MGFKRSFVGICLVLLALAWSTPARSASPIPMKTAWLGEHETFRPSGMPSRKDGTRKPGWISPCSALTRQGHCGGRACLRLAIAGCGAVPALTAALSERLDIIAVANDESAANALYARADSPLLSIKGTNPAYPDIYGDQATVKGKEILCPKGTSAHYMMAAWAQVIGP